MTRWKEKGRDAIIFGHEISRSPIVKGTRPAQEALSKMEDKGKRGTSGALTSIQDHLLIRRNDALKGLSHQFESS
jgi:hypothetical protein